MKYLHKAFLILSIVALFAGVTAISTQAAATYNAKINNQDITGNGATIAVPSGGGSVNFTVTAHYSEIADRITIDGLTSSSGVDFYINGVWNKGTVTLVNQGAGTVTEGTDAEIDVTAEIQAGVDHLSFPLEVRYYANGSQTAIPLSGTLHVGQQTTPTRLSLYPENKSNVTLGKAADFVLREWVVNNPSDGNIGTVNLKNGYTPNPRTVTINPPSSEPYKDISVRVDLEIVDSSALADTRYTAVISNTTGSSDLVRVTPNPVTKTLSRSAGTTRFFGTEYLTLRVYRNASGNYPITFSAVYDSGRGETTRSETITINVPQGSGSWQPVDLLSANSPSLSIINAGAYNIQNLSLLRLTSNYVNPYTGKFALLSGLGESAPGDPGVFFQPDGYSPDTVRIQASYQGNTTEGSVNYTCPYCVMFDGKQNDVVEKGNSTTFKVVRKDGGNLYTTKNWNWAPRALRNGVDVTGTEISFTNVYSNGTSAFFTVTPTNAAPTGARYKLHLYSRTLPNTPNYSVPQFAHPNTPTTVIAESIADLAIATPTEDPASITGTVTNVNTRVVRPSTNTHTHTLTLQKENISSTSLAVSARVKDPAKGSTVTTMPTVQRELVSSTTTQDVYAIYADAPAGTNLGDFVAEMDVSAISTSGQTISENYTGDFSVVEVVQPSFSFTLSPANKEICIPSSGQATVSYNIFVTRTGGFPALSAENFTILLGLSDRNISALPPGSDWRVRAADASDRTGGAQPDFVLDIYVGSDAIATPESGDTFSLLATKSYNGTTLAKSAQSSLTICETPVVPSYSFTLSPPTRETDIPQSGTTRVSYDVFVTRTGGFPALSTSDFTILIGLNDRNIYPLPGTDWNMSLAKPQDRVGGTQPDFTLNIDVPSDAIATPDSGDTFTLFSSKNGVAASASATLILNDTVVTPTPSYSFSISPSNKTATIPPAGKTEVVPYDVFVYEDIGFPTLTTGDFTALFGLNDRGIALIPGPDSWYMSVPKRGRDSVAPYPDFTLNLVVSPDAPATPSGGDIFTLLALKNGVVKSASSTLTLKEVTVPQDITLTITPDNRNVTVPTTGTVSTTYNVNIIRPQDVDAFSVSDLSIDSLLPGITGSFAPNTRARVGENEQQFTLTLTVAPNTPGSSSGMEDIFTVAVEDVGGNVLDSDDSAITLTKNVVVQGITLSMPAQKNIKERTGNVMIVSFPITAVRTGNVGTLSPENFSLSPDPLADGVTHSFTNTSWSDCDSGSAPAGSSCHLVTFSIPSSIANDSYPFTVTASRSGVSGSAQSVLNVSDIPPPPPPPSLVTCTIAANPSSGNDPLSSTLTMTARGGVAPYTYNIDADGDGTWESSGSSPSYTHTYSQGSYTARGQVIDALGDRGICSTPVTVNAPIMPLACTLSASKTEGIVTLWTQFTLSATGGSGTKSYQIDPGDGRPSYSVAQHTHDYRTSGIYTAVGTVSDDSGSTSCDVTIRAYDLGGGETNPGGN